jgi:hypothetical protein
MKSVKRLFRVLYEPFKVFSEMEEKPEFLFPFLTVIILSVILFIITFPSTYSLVMERIMERVKELPKEQQEKALQFYTYQKMYIFGIIRTLLFLPIVILAQAGIFLLIFPLLGSQLTFRSSLTSVSYASWISFLGNLFKTVLMIIKKGRIHTDLTLFLPQIERGFIYRILSNVDFFTIFSLFILSTGFAVFGKVERKKTLFLVYTLWIIFIIIGAMLPAGKPGAG